MGSEGAGLEGVEMADRMERGVDLEGPWEEGARVGRWPCA